MFDYLKGIVTYVELDKMVVEVNGVGFMVGTSTMSAGKVSKNQEVTVFTELVITENDMRLFGFLSRDELDMFKNLRSVTKVGPSHAIAIMSCLSVDEIKMAILADDSKTLSKTKGIGVKLAQQIILTLKDKYKLEDVYGGFTEDTPMPDGAGTASEDVITEVAMALSSLGYSNVDALRAIKKVPNSEHMAVEELLKASLKNIGL